MNRIINRALMLLGVTMAGTLVMAISSGAQDGAAGSPTPPATHSKLRQTLGSDVGSVGCQLQDKDGNLWFSTPGNGVFRFDGRGGAGAFTNFTTKDGLSDNGVGQIIQNKAGNILIATGKGICQFDAKSEVFTKRADLGEHPVTCLLEDRAGNLWFATMAEDVFRVDAKDGTLTNFLTSAALQGPRQFNLRNTYQLILDMHEDRPGNIWFSSWNGGGVWQYSWGKDGVWKNHLPDADYYKVTDGSSESGRDGAGPSLGPRPSADYKSKTATISDDMIFSIAEDSAGKIWFATRRHGACRYDPAKDEFTTFRHKEGFGSVSVYSIMEDRKGNIWLTTEAAGVWRLGGDGKSFRNFTTKDGLVNDSVFSALEDRDGNLWFGTRGVGLSRYDGTSFTTYSE